MCTLCLSSIGPHLIQNHADPGHAAPDSVNSYLHWLLCLDSLVSLLSGVGSPSVYVSLLLVNE